MTISGPTDPAARGSVDPARLDPDSGTELVEDPTAEELSALPDASPGKLFWRAFRRHRLALISLIVLIGLYVVVLVPEFLAPASADRLNASYAYAPPQSVHLKGTAPDGSRHLLYVRGFTSQVDQETNAISYQSDASKVIGVGFFVHGDQYKLFGLIRSDIHLIGPKHTGDPFFLLGADATGRDLLSRMIFGTRVSMSIGLVGVLIAFILGVILGGVSGYFGGRIDSAIQRVIEFFMSIPTLPLWLALAAAMPLSWGALTRYFAITVILAIIAWTGLARVVRGRFLSIRSEEYVLAAELDGNSVFQTIIRHMLPSFTSHLIAQLTLSIPSMIIAETSLSFLGLGLAPPAISWGVLLQSAQSLRAIVTAPWLLLPGVAVIIAVLALNFMGDGLRDAADPYRR